MRFERLPGLPPYGPREPSVASNTARAWSFAFGPRQNWVGNFHGGHGRAESVVDHPDKRRVVVLASGQGYVIDPEAPNDVRIFGFGIHEFFALQSSMPSASLMTLNWRQSTKRADGGVGPASRGMELGTLKLKGPISTARPSRRLVRCGSLSRRFKDWRVRGERL